MYSRPRCRCCTCCSTADSNQQLLILNTGEGLTQADAEQQQLHNGRSIHQVPAKWLSADTAAAAAARDADGPGSSGFDHFEHFLQELTQLEQVKVQSNESHSASAASYLEAATLQQLKQVSSGLSQTCTGAAPPSMFHCCMLSCKQSNQHSHIAM